jgi:RHS repeat-associated protein
VYGKTKNNASLKTHPKTGQAVDPKIRFQGQWEDLETGLYQNLHRFYDPHAGRYINHDPIGLMGGLNAYQYCPNPVGWVDPLGLSCKEIGSVEGSYDAMNPGPLPPNLAETFAGGRYKEVILESNTVLYRAGTESQPLGQFFSQEKPLGVIQTRIDKAVLPEWPGGGKSPIDTVFEVKIPAGTKVYIGEVSSQSGFYIGGSEQVVVVQPWLIDGVQVVGSRPLI